jgi:hypothetical protein
VNDEADMPLEGAWVALPDGGRWAATDQNGRFTFARVSPGTHKVVARTADGREAAGTVTVPGGRCDLVAAAPRKRSART